MKHRISIFLLSLLALLVTTSAAHALIIDNEVKTVPPSAARITFTQPTNKAEVSVNDSLTVSGTYLRDSQIKDLETVTVNGIPATKPQLGTWTVNVPVVEGWNTITATVSHINVNSSYSKTIHVFNTLPAPTLTPEPTGDGGGSNGGGSSGDTGSDPEPQPSVSKSIQTQVRIASADRTAPDFIVNLTVPAVVEQTFFRVFGRKINHAESVYWKNRARTDKATESKLLGTMLWHKGRGSTGVKSRVAGTSSTIQNLVPSINRLFRSVYLRDPSSPENRYWLSRIADKPSGLALIGAMGYHRANTINH